VSQYTKYSPAAPDGVTEVTAASPLASSGGATPQISLTGIVPIANQASQPTTVQIYVDKNRADVYTADGTTTRPYLTIKAAFDAITDAGGNKKYEIIIAPGNYVEDNALILKPWISLISNVPETVSIRRQNNTAITYDTGASDRSAYVGISFSGGGITIDRATSTGGSTIRFENCSFTGQFTFSGRGSGADTLDLRDCLFITTFTLNAAVGNIYNCIFYSTFTSGTTGGVVADGYGYLALVTLFKCYTATTTALSSNVGHAAAFQAWGTPSDGAWTVTANGTIDFILDVASGHTLASSLTRTGSVTTYFQNRAYNAGYTPLAASWAGAAPTNVQDALNRMAALLKTLNGGAPIP
jgi:hypothetical protein